MKRDAIRGIVRKVEQLARDASDWVSLASHVGEIVRDVVAFDRTCWHPVDPGTYLFTGSLSHNMTCSGAWLAEYEYVVTDVNKWHDLARGERHAASLSQATGGDVLASARARSSADYGLVVSDELRVAFVVDGVYWGAAGFIRGEGERPFEPDEIDMLAALSAPIAEGFRRSVVTASDESAVDHDDAPGVIVFDERGGLESISPAAERLIAQIVEIPPPSAPHESRAVQAVAACARRLMTGGDSVASAPRARVQATSGRWLGLHATPLSGDRTAKVAVIIQPAGLHDVAPLVARAYALTERERRITRMCLEGLSTRAIATALDISEYTVQDHLKSIFFKTGTRTRGELVGRVFLEHYVPRFEAVDDIAGGWLAETITRRRSR
jgi:DNA-binding CsgD family transcriptional regulator